jgi:hypothetical protein
MQCNLGIWHSDVEFEISMAQRKLTKHTAGPEQQQNAGSEIIMYPERPYAALEGCDFAHFSDTNITKTESMKHTIIIFQPKRNPVLPIFYFINIKN